MTPTPQECVPHKVNQKFSRLFAKSDDDEIVISGISGKFPNCANVDEFEHNLFNKVDMVKADDGKQYILDGLPNRVGKVCERDKFDATFFRIHFKQAKCMDPQCRFLLETAYESVLDAGVNPTQLRGTKTGVFVGASFSEAEKAWFYELILPGGFGITGCCRAMMANRISFCLGLNGPSYLIDAGGNSSLQSLTTAYNSLRNGEIDAAIVGGANVILFTCIDLQFKKLGNISTDGFCRPFDQNSSGYNRSETISCVFLQRKRDAKRVYAQLVHARANYDGYKADGIAQVSADSKKKLLENFYSEIKFNPRDLAYIEANANGVPNEDIVECDIIDSTICKYREEPLLIGSVKSNIGQTDAAAGLAAIVKSCLTFKNGKIPPNLNFSQPRREIDSIREGRLKVVSESQPLPGAYIGINSYSFSGENSHALLKAFDKKKINNGIPDDDLPRLINWSGRTEESIEHLLKELDGKTFDAELIGLLHDINSTPTPGNLFRGYGLLSKDEHGKGKVLVRDCQHYSGIQRPVVWLFSGMGSQWAGMGASLMQIPIVRESLQRCHIALEPKGLNLIDILTSTDPHTFDNILHSFVGIAAIQIALVDLLKSLNLSPDYIIGHSVGELGCGYADGGFTAEQMILSSYSRGKVSLDTQKIVGSMAAVGLGYNKIVNMLPPAIEVACRNSFESSTISGPAEEINKFVEELKGKKIFAKEVPCSNIAYHSKYIAQMGPHLLKYLSEIIPKPKPRSEKWLSSSVPKSNWNNPEAQYCSAEYHTNNLLNSVLFEDTANMLPKDALCIEIAPHGLLQAILKRSMPNAVHVGLTQRGNANNHHFLLQALGKIYVNGIDMPLQTIYPKIEYPVSNDTRSISSLVKWDHKDNWNVSDVSTEKKTQEQKIKISLRKPEFAFLYGYKVDNRVLVPPMLLVQIVADFYANLQTLKLMDMDIQFDGIKVKKYLFLTETDEIDLHLMISPGNGFFSITEDGINVLEGTISTMLGTDELTNIKDGVEKSSTPVLSSADFYKELELRGEEYQGVFRGVVESHGDGSRGKIIWNGFYFAFLESLIQVSTIGTDIRTPKLPCRIRQVKLFGKQHLDTLVVDDVFNFENSSIYKRIVAGGVEIVGLETKHIDRREPYHEPNLSMNQFIPNFPSPLLTTADAVRCCIQTAIENSSSFKEKVKVVEYANENHGQQPLVKYFMQEFKNIPKIGAQCFLITDEDVYLPDIQIEEGSISNHANCTFVVLNNALDNVGLADEAAKCLIDGGFMLSRETLKGNIKSKKLPIGFNCVAILNTSDEILILLNKVKRVRTSGNTLAIKVSESDNSWIATLRNLKERSKIVLYTENEKFSGILGMVNCLKDFGSENAISFVFIDDKNAPAFNLNNDFYRRQLDLGLTVNVFKDGQWGSYQNLYLKPVAKNVRKFYADIDHPGDLSTLNCYQTNDFASTECIEVAYAAINSRDVVLATGRVPKDIYGKSRKEQSNLLGVEFSGIDVITKKRIMGIKAKNAFSSHINAANMKCTWTVPEHWTLEEAATVPYAYAMVYYAYFQVIKIRLGHSILIHDAASDLGIAAVRIAIASGLEVFATVRTDEQKEILLQLFLDMQSDHIASCLDNSFETMIQDKLDNGVNYILNTLSGSQMQASLRCLATQSHMFEFGRYDMSENTHIGLGEFLKEITFHTVSLERYLAESDEKLANVHRLVQADIDNGIIVPLPVKTYPATQLQEAFSFAANLQFPGKILVNMKEQSEEAIIPQVYFDPQLSYVVCDELNVFGLEFIDWMIQRGAKNILLHASKLSNFKENRIALLKSYGVNLQKHSEDITTKSGCLSLLNTATKLLGPIGGIFCLTSIENKMKFELQSPAEFTAAIAPHINQMKFLDQLSVQMCPELKYFVLMTNLCDDTLNQLPKSMLNSMYEKLIENRQLQNLPGKILTFGSVEHETRSNSDNFVPQEIRSCLQVMDKFLLANGTTVSSVIIGKNKNAKSIQGHDSVYEDILNLTGISDDVMTSNETKNLSEIGINPLIALQIQKLLDKKLNLNLSFDELTQMELRKIKTLSSTHRKSVTQTKLKLNRDKRAKGISAILPSMTEVSMNMETLLHVPNSSIEKINPVIIIPGIEGAVSNVWNNAVKNWNSYPLALQLHSTKDAQSVEEIAQSVFKDVHHALKKTTKFFFVAYSFGSLLALELAALLEQEGYKGKILLIDGAPHFMRELLKNSDGNQLTDEQILNQIFAIILSHIDNQPAEKFFGEFSHHNSYDEKVNKFREFVKLQSKYSEEFALSMVQTMYNRIKMIRKYKETADKINSPIMLVKPKEVSIVDIEEDYKLSAVTTSDVEIKYIDGNHFTILDNKELNLIVNDFDPSRDEQENFQNYLEKGYMYEVDFN